MDSFRLAIRQLLKSPGFTIVVLCVLLIACLNLSNLLLLDAHPAVRRQAFDPGVFAIDAAVAAGVALLAALRATASGPMCALR